MSRRRSWLGERLGGLTTRGRCLLAAGLALVLCALVLGQRDLLRAAVFLVVLPIAAVAIVARTSYRLSCVRHLEPYRVEVGSTSTVKLRLENVSRLPSGVLLMEDVLPFVLGGRPRFVLDRVEPRGSRDVTYPVASDVRGRFPIGPLAVRLTDPFGLCELDRSFSSTDELVVTPVVTPLPAVRLGGDWAGGGESSARSISTSGLDDAGTREYRHGDDVRRVHWRSTARVGELMVRREEQPFQNRATLLLDGRAGAHRGEGAGSSFEWSVSAVASIGVALARSGYALHLLREDGEPVAPAAASLPEGLLLESLAGVTTSRAPTLDVAVEQLRRGGYGGVLVAVLGVLDLEQAERLSRLRAGGSACVAVLVDADGWTSLGPRVRAASQQTHTQVAALLARTGWRVLPVPHGTTLASLWPLAGAPGSRSSASYRPVPMKSPT